MNISEKMFGAQGTPEQIKKTVEENLTDGQKAQSEIREESMLGGELRARQEEYLEIARKNGREEATLNIMKQIESQGIEDGDEISIVSMSGRTSSPDRGYIFSSLDKQGGINCHGQIIDGVMCPSARSTVCITEVTNLKEIKLVKKGEKK